MVGVAGNYIFYGFQGKHSRLHVSELVNDIRSSVQCLVKENLDDSEDLPTICAQQRMLGDNEVFCLKAN